MTKPHDYVLVSLPAHVGRDFGLSRARRVAQSRIDQFAECSGDDQWIHVDVERARNSPLGNTIAHGLLLLSLITKAQYDVGVYPDDAAQILNYGLDKVRFLAPVAEGSSVLIRVELTDVQSRGRPHAGPLPQHCLLRERPRPPGDGGRVARHANDLTEAERR